MSGKQRSKPSKGCRNYDKKVLKLCKLLKKRGIDKRVQQGVPKGTLSGVTKRAQAIYNQAGRKGGDVPWKRALQLAAAEQKGYKLS